MKTVSISGSPRVSVGKKDAKAIRKEGKVPCVLYGGKEQVSFTAFERDFKTLIYTPEVHTVKLEVDGRSFNAIMQDVQFHPVTDQILHVDFLEVIPNKPITMRIPVKFSGNSVGVRAGGKLIKKQNKLRVKGLIEKMPEAITIPIDDLNIGQSVRVSEVSVDGLTLLDSPNVTVVTVKVTRNVAAATTDATAAKGGAKDAKKDAKK